MKIISKHKDYYDGVQSYGMDNSTIYFRKTEIVEFDKEDPIEVELNKHASFQNVIRIRNKQKDEKDLYLCNVIIGFCGKLHLVKCIQTPNSENKTQQIFFYNNDDLKEYFKKREKLLVLEDLKFIKSDFTWRRRKGMHWNEFLKEFENFEGEYNHIFHKLSEPVFLFPSFVFENEILEKNLWLGSFHWEKNKFIVNPILKSIGFQQVKHAYQCYQDIEQYLNGVLSNTEKNEDNRTDIEKVKSHGFDEKYGFRKRKKE
jgi:hypothetical protein